MILLALIGIAAVGVYFYLKNHGGTVPEPTAPTPSVPPVSSNLLSAGELYVLAVNAGFPAGEQAILAAAVALAESGGNVRAYNPETQAGTPEGEGSYGLWQIYLHAHPEYSGHNLYDPQQNASAAYEVYRAAGRTFRPWSTYKNGAYTAHLNDVREVVSV